MYGLIAADSLGIPNFRMVLSDKIIGGDYKYNDYYSISWIENHNYIDLIRQDFSDKDLPSTKANYQITQGKFVELQGRSNFLFSISERRFLGATHQEGSG